MKTRSVVVVLCVGLVLAPVRAQFGFGLTVFDPTSWGELVQQLTQLQHEYSQLVKTYDMVTNQYNQMVINATMITSKMRWQAALTPWTFPSASNIRHHGRLDLRAKHRSRCAQWLSTSGDADPNLRTGLALA